mmetsp:Transcript_3462/g.5341  ORF Transcript_3462/g.5341 Transcript_3462/m.5341 type:complete len:247 (-) Transcript_3462:1916-2656(-)
MLLAVVDFLVLVLVQNGAKDCKKESAGKVKASFLDNSWTMGTKLEQTSESRSRQRGTKLDNNSKLTYCNFVSNFLLSACFSASVSCLGLLNGTAGGGGMGGGTIQSAGGADGGAEGGGGGAGNAASGFFFFFFRRVTTTGAAGAVGSSSSSSGSSSWSSMTSASSSSSSSLSATTSSSSSNNSGSSSSSSTTVSVSKAPMQCKAYLRVSKQSSSITISFLRFEVDDSWANSSMAATREGKACCLDE